MTFKQKLNLKTSSKNLVTAFGMIFGLIAVLALALYLFSASIYGSTHVFQQNSSGAFGSGDIPPDFPSQEDCPELYQENPNFMIVLQECHAELSISPVLGVGLQDTNILPFGPEWFCAGSGTEHDSNPDDPRPWFEWWFWDSNDVTLGMVDSRAWALLLCTGFDTSNLEDSMLCQDGPANNDDEYDPVSLGHLDDPYYYPWSMQRDPQRVGAEVAAVCAS